MLAISQVKQPGAPGKAGAFFRESGENPLRRRHCNPVSRPLTPLFLVLGDGKARVWR